MHSVDNVLKKILEGRYEETLLMFPPLLNDKKSRLESLGHRAWLYRTLGRYEEAISDYEAMLIENPNDFYGEALLAETMLLAGKIEEALKKSLEIIQKDPSVTYATKIIKDCQQSLGFIPVPSATPPNHTKTAPVKPINSAIDMIEKDANSYPGSIFPEVGRFLYSFVRCYRPKLAMETGSYIGYSALCIAQALEDNGGGHLHSFDLFVERPNYISPIIGKCSDSLQVARSHIEKGNLSHRVTFFKGDSSTMIENNLGDGSKLFDFAFIDGDHRIKGCLKDWFVIDKMLAEGGIVLLHDTMPNECGWLGPRYLLEELDKRYPAAYACLNIPTPEGYGIGLVQKKMKNSSKKWRPSFLELFTEWFFNKKFKW